MSIKRKRQLGEERSASKHRKTSPEAIETKTNSHGDDAVPSETPDDQTLSKAERKALRKQQKEDRANESGAPVESKEEKRRRKAEKKAAKALKAGKSGLSSPAASDTAPDVPAKKEQSKPKSSEQEKEDRRSGKEVRGQKAVYDGALTKQFLETHSITYTDSSHNTQCTVLDSFAKLPDKAVEILKPFQHFDKPTPIQAASWHAMLQKRDVVGVAETGSGKTLAFGVPLIDHVLRKAGSKPGVSALVVSPTRELAVQIQEQIAVLAKPHGLRSVCIYGGVPKDPQREELKRANIVIATPGRLNDFLDEGGARLSATTYVVLDEADRMLDKGFEEAIRKIISATSKVDRQTLMFTATWPPSVRELAATFMRDPVRITIGTDADGSLRANTRIKQVVEVVTPQEKEGRLLELLRQHQSGKNKDARILVFCLYKKEATRIENLLWRKGHRVAGIHGDLSQERRSASLESFKTGKTPLLVATDVAARGLDIPDVRVVLNVTFPLTAEDYVHRIGRTGRAGADGLAITLFTEHDKGLSGALVNVLKAAGQPVPDELLKFGTAVKKKAHDSYGAFYRAPEEGAKKATKITFDD